VRRHDFLKSTLVASSGPLFWACRPSESSGGPVPLSSPALSFEQFTAIPYGFAGIA